MILINIGRGDTNEVTISESEVSKLHAQLVLDDNNDIFINDLQSQNGTYVNGVIISEPTQLKSGDIVKLAGIPFRWETHLPKSKITETTVKQEEPAPPPLNSQTPPPLTNTTANAQKKSFNWTKVNWTKWIVWIIIGIISLALTAVTEGGALVVILPALGIYFVWVKIGGLKVFSILSLILSVAGIIGGLGLALYANEQLRYDPITDLRQMCLVLGAGIAIYSIYFLAYSITVLASVRKNKIGMYETK